MKKETIIQVIVLTILCLAFVTVFDWASKTIRPKPATSLTCQELTTELLEDYTRYDRHELLAVMILKECKLINPSIMNK